MSSTFTDFKKLYRTTLGLIIVSYFLPFISPGCSTDGKKSQNIVKENILMMPDGENYSGFGFLIKEIGLNLMYAVFLSGLLIPVLLLLKQYFKPAISLKWDYGIVLLVFAVFTWFAYNVLDSAGIIKWGFWVCYFFYFMCFAILSLLFNKTNLPALE